MNYVDWRWILMGLMTLLNTACASAAYQVSDHYDGERFFTPWQNDVKTFGDFLKWQMNSEKKSWPESVPNHTKPRLPSQVKLGEVAVTWINHATHLLQFSGITMITDPIYSDRASPLSFAGPRRVRPPGVPFDQLPKIDAVLVTHNHYDHMDLETLKKLAQRFSPLFVVPLGNAAILKSAGIEKVREFDWWQSIDFESAATRLTLVPSQHWSARGFFDRNKALWCGFLITQQNLTVYFSGDTGYGPHFQEVAKRAGRIDVAILPIGAYEPRWFMKAQHMNPEEAVRAHQDVGAKLSLASHFGFFQLTDEAYDDPLRELGIAIEKQGLKAGEFQAPDPGVTVGYDRTAGAR